MEEEEAGAAEALLRFMYTGGLEPAVAGKAAELLRLMRLADRFQVGAVGQGWRSAVGPMSSRIERAFGWSGMPQIPGCS